MESVLPLASVHVDSEFIGVALILTTIGTFGALIAVSITLIHTVKSIWLARISRSMISELLAKGYSPDEVAMLIHGKKKSGFKWLSFGKTEMPVSDKSQPVPPVKNRVF